MDNIYKVYYNPRWENFPKGYSVQYFQQMEDTYTFLMANKGLIYDVEVFNNSKLTDVLDSAGLIQEG